MGPVLILVGIGFNRMFLDPHCRFIVPIDGCSLKQIG